MSSRSDGARESARQLICRCTLLFSDGAVVTGEITAGSRYDECAIVYSGALERLPFLFETADFVFLRALFREYAQQLSAAYQEQLTGVWDGPSSGPVPSASPQPVLPP